MKFQKDCKHPFFVTCKYEMYGNRGCEIKLESGWNLGQMPIPYGVRFSFSSITRYYASEEGQALISKEVEKRTKFIEDYNNKKMKQTS